MPTARRLVVLSIVLATAMLPGVGPAGSAPSGFDRRPVSS